MNTLSHTLTPARPPSEGGSSDATTSAAPMPFPLSAPYLQDVMFDEDSEGSDVPTRGLYRSIFEKAHEATVVFDESNRLILRNRAARQQDARLLERIFAVDGPQAQDLASFRAEIARAGRSQLELSVDGREVVLRGQAHGGCHVVTLNDVTEFRRIEGELRAIERVESVGLLTASLVHDFNNLLMPIAATSGCLLLELKEGSEAIEMARDIKRAADRAASLARQVLKLARRGPPRQQDVSLNSVLSDLLPIVKRVVGSAISVDVVRTRSAALVRLDREGLERVILNLVANARDAMPSGGRVTLSTTEISLDAEEAHAIPGAAKGAYVALRVSDTGMGISSEVRERIFEGFFTTKNAGRGTGLGLSTARRFVAQCGGCIAVHSQPGRGTLVSLYFPIVHQA